MQPVALPVNKAADDTLNAHLAALNLPPLKNISGTPNTNRIENTNFTFQPNALNIQGIHFKFTGKECKVVLDENSKTYNLTFDAGKWAAGETLLQGPSLLAKAHENFSMLSPYKIDCSYGWVDDNTLRLKMRYIESPHSKTITCHIVGDKLNVTVEDSFAFGKNKIELVAK
jgi:hypothetical protein